MEPVSTAEGDAGLPRRDQQQLRVLVAADPVKDFLVGASVEPEWRLIGAVHGRGARRADSQRRRSR
jgi:hypothetical protein